MNAEVLNSDQIPDPTAVPPVRKKRHLAGIAVGFLIPLFLIWIAWLKHIPSDEQLAFLFMCVPLVCVGLFVSCRSWRRWFYPARLPVRWVEDSVWLKRLKVLDWVVYGMSAVVMLGIIVLMFRSEDAMRSRAAHYMWIVYSASMSFRAILMQVREDRKPLSPPSSPTLGLSQLSTDKIKPVYSKDWDNASNADSR